MSYSSPDKESRLLEFDACEDTDLRQSSVAPVNCDETKPTIEFRIPEELAARTGKTLATLQKELGFGYSKLEDGMAVFEKNIDVLAGEKVQEWKDRNKELLAKVRENISICLSPYLVELSDVKYESGWYAKINLKEKGQVESIRANTGEVLLNMLTTPTR